MRDPGLRASAGRTPRKTNLMKSPLLRTPLAIVAIMLAFASPASAQDKYPSRTVEIVVPFAAGGGTDVLARMLAEGLSRRLKQSFVVINRPGANTNLGTQIVVKSAPDGYTLAMASLGIAANPSLYGKLPFRPLQDLAPISLLANAPTILVVNPALPAKTLQEFIAYVKSKPGALNYASYGAGSGPHLATELFKWMTGVQIVHVPYSGGGPAAVGVTGGQVQMLFASVLPVLSLVRSGKLKPIAIAADHRSPLLPDVPTFKEGGLEYVTGTWFGLLAPAKTPQSVIKTLHANTVEVLKNPVLHKRMSGQGADVVGNTPDEFRAHIVAETERLARVIKNANIRLD
jgi:tripartite-type tricarboxylate transporter receptor subunit TctC